MQLACRMAHERNARILRRHAAAVVGYADIGRTAAFEFYRHLFCACVKGVFRKLLYHGGGPLHDLARRYHIRKKRRKNIYLCHAKSSVLCHYTLF